MDIPLPIKEVVGGFNDLFTDAAGRSATFRAGDTFIIEQGADCTWDSKVDVAKIYSLFNPDT